MHYTHPLWRDLANHFVLAYKSKLQFLNVIAFDDLREYYFSLYHENICVVLFESNRFSKNRIYEIVLIVDIITLLYANLVVMYTDWLAHSTGCQLKLKHCSIFLQQEKNNAGVGFSTSISYKIIYLWQSLSFCTRKGAINTE